MNLNVKSIAVGAVSVAIMAFLATSILIPVLEESTDHEITFNNIETAQCYVDAADETTTFAGTAAAFYVNGELTRVLNANFSTVVSENIAIRSSGGNLHVNVFSLNNVRDLVGDINLTANNGRITGTVGTESVDVEYTHLYYAYAANGEYVMTNGNGAKLNGSTPITCMAFNASAGTVSSDRWYYIEGSINEGFTATSISGTTYDASKVNAVEVEEFIDLFTLTSVEFELNNGTTLTIGNFITAANVTAEKVHDDSIDAIISVIPILIFVGLVLGVIGMFVARRD